MTKLLPTFLFASLILFASCAKRVEPFREGSSTEGYASWYGNQFHGRRTASGEVYNMNAMTGAHRNAPFGTLVEVTNLDNNKTTTVRINDRGPFVRGRIIDLSRAAAKDLGMLGTGTAHVRLAFLGKRSPPPPPEPPPSQSPPPVKEETFYLQIASFKEYSNATNFKEEFDQFHSNAHSQIIEQDGFYRVWLGPYDLETDAQQVQNDLKNEGKPTVLLRR